MFASFALAVALFYAPQHPFQAPRISEEIVTGSRWITVVVEPPQSTGPEYKTDVYFTAEPILVVSTEAHTELKEADVAGSGLAMDLNGDGDREDVLPTSCEGKRLTIGGTTLRPLMTSQQMQYTEQTIGRIGEKGAHVIQYTACGPFLALGLAPASHPIEQQHLQGPMVQISVAQPQSGPRDLPTLRTSRWTLDGKPMSPSVAQVKSFEPGEQKTPTWVHVHWATLSIPVGGRHTIRFLLDGPGEAAISAGVNVAPAPGRRWRGPMGFMKLKSMK